MNVCAFVFVGVRVHICVHALCVCACVFAFDSVHVRLCKWKVIETLMDTKIDYRFIYFFAANLGFSQDLLRVKDEVRLSSPRKEPLTRGMLLERNSLDTGERPRRFDLDKEKNVVGHQRDLV